MRGIAAQSTIPSRSVLTGIDLIVRAFPPRPRASRSEARRAAEGREVTDRLVSPEAAGIPGCDFVIVASRRKAGWERGVAVFTQDGCYRLGEPIERTINGRLRTLYPFTEHRDFEAVRKSVRYELPGRPPS